MRELRMYLASDVRPPKPEWARPLVAREHHMDASTFQVMIVASTKGEAAQELINLGLGELATVKLMKAATWLNGRMPDTIRILFNAGLFQGHGVWVWHEVAKDKAAVQIKKVEDEVVIEPVAHFRLYPGADQLLVETPNPGSGRIHWKRSSNGWSNIPTGHVAGLKLFTISSSQAARDKFENWAACELHSALPGHESARWVCEDEEKAHERAEHLLGLFLTRIGATWAE
jgi:hypothetical protein